MAGDFNDLLKFLKFVDYFYDRTVIDDQGEAVVNNDGSPDFLLSLWLPSRDEAGSDWADGDVRGHRDGALQASLRVSFY